MKITYLILHILALCSLLLPGLPGGEASPADGGHRSERSPRRRFGFNRLQQRKQEYHPVKALEPRIPRFSGGNSTNESEAGVAYVRLSSGTNQNEPVSGLTTKTDCSKTYVMEDDSVAMIYSRHDKYAYTCTTTFKAAGAGSSITVECPNYSLKFNCFFESLTLKIDGTNHLYCRNMVIPRATGKEITLKYVRNIMGFHGGYVCVLVAKPPGSEAGTDPQKAKGKCGTTASMERSKDNHRIVGGHNADRDGNPWIAFLKMSVSRYNYEYRCGGEVITERHILTAGHCLYGYDVNHIEVGLGKYDLSVHGEAGAIWKKTTIYKVHESYDDDLILHDIAIVTLKDKLTFSDVIRPICLPQPDATIPADTEVTAIGWGSISYGGREAEILQEVSLDIKTNANCQGAWRTKFKDHQFSIFDTQVCAMGIGKDTCSGDSGGPLYYKLNGTYVLVGITSYGHRCADPDVPAVYTRVSKYLDWINKNTQ